ARAPWLALADARRPPEAPGPVAAVVTSPPYPGVYDYAAHHERRYSILGMDAELARAREIGARREVRHHGTAAGRDAYVAGMAEVFGAWRRHLAPDGLIFLVVGDGQDPDGPIPVLPLIEHAAANAGCALAASVSQPRPSFGPAGGMGRVKPSGSKEEHIIALRRDAP
ncbi:MAG: hypothetical protein EP329_05570, partial [Deltaproteobacteria bacterium]